MPDSKRRRLMIKERMDATGEPFMVASRGIGAWWQQNRKGMSPKEPKEAKSE
jgi:hypothetical protein